MLKRILLATSTLAVILVLFLIYHLSTGGAPEPGTEPIVKLVEQKDVQLPELTKELDVFDPPKVKDIPILHGGKKAWVTWYDKKTRRAKLKFRATTWEPIAESEFHLIDLEVRMLMPGGQIAEVRADEGQVLMTPGDLSDSTARRGWLKGNVRVLIDRTTPEWREEHPDLKDVAQHPERTVRIWMDEFNFDLELSGIETGAEFRLQGANADLQGRGLKLSWNEDEDRIEYLEITEGKEVELRGYKANLDFALLGGRMAGAQKQDAAPDEPLASADEAIQSEEPPADDAGEEVVAVPTEPEPDPDLLVLEPVKKKHRRPVSYQASFSRNVVASQHRGLEDLGKLTADTLSLVFDAGRIEKAGEQGPDGADHDEKETAQTDKDKDTRLVLTWDGPLIVTPEDLSPTDSSLQRLHVIATGSPLVLDDPQGEATCHRLEYHDETGELQLIGAPNQPVTIRTGMTKSMQAESLAYDRSRNVARLEGAGEMLAGSVEFAQGQSQPLDQIADSRTQNTLIRWTHWVELEIGMARMPVKDPDTGLTRSQKSPYVKRAVLDGGVVLEQRDQRAQADHMDVEFSEPDRPGRMVSDVQVFRATGGVRLTSTDDDIGCDELVLHMSTTSSGRNVPTSALATGRVTARQKQRIVQTTKQMKVTMREIADPQTKITVDQARMIARSRGLDPEQVNWDEWAKRQAERTRTAIVGLEARGDVRIDDPSRGLRVRADELDCVFPDGRKIDTATVISHAPRTSEVRIEDYAIKGRRIDLNASLTWALVPGPGQVEFYTNQDLDGSPLDEPLPVAVSWAGRMEMRGEANQLYFEEQVRSSSTDVSRQHYNLDCDRLAINFIDLAEPQQVSSRTTAPSTFWILQPIVDLVAGSGAESSGGDSIASGGSVFRKKPVFILADGNAAAMSSRYDPIQGALQNRMRISGPRIAVDLRRETTNVEGAGNLLIEDYRIPTPGEARPESPTGPADPMLGGMGRSGPSQTLITWENSMSFLTRRNVAVFDRSVELWHVTGAEMAYVKDVARARNLDLDLLRNLGGRKVTLECDNLLVEFARVVSAGDGTLEGAARSATLRVMEATDDVTLVDNSKTLVGQQLTYLRDTGQVTIRAARGRDAHIYDEDKKSGSLRAHWKGPVLRWNLNSNRIEASDSTILLSGR